jgi:hypothetical protein
MSEENGLALERSLLSDTPSEGGENIAKSGRQRKVSPGDIAWERTALNIEDARSTHTRRETRKDKL